MVMHLDVPFMHAIEVLTSGGHYGSEGGGHPPPNNFERPIKVWYQISQLASFTKL